MAYSGHDKGLLPVDVIDDVSPEILEEFSFVLPDKSGHFHSCSQRSRTTDEGST